MGLEGYVITAEHRDGVLAWLRGDSKPDEPITVYCGPQAQAFWAFAPPSVEVIIVPGDREIPRTRRIENETAWFLHRAGVALSEAKGLALKLPTTKHKHYLTFLQALKDAADWCEVVPVSPLDFPYIGQRPSTGTPYTWSAVTSLSVYTDLSEALNRARQHDEVIGLDVETDEEEQIDILVGVGFAFGDQCYYLPLNGPLGSELSLTLLRYHFVEHLPVKFVAHNGKFDAQALARALVPEPQWTKQLRHLTSCLVGDGFIAAYVAARVGKDGRPEEKGLKPLARRYFGVDMITFQEMLDSCGATRSSEAPLDTIAPYCCADAYYGLMVERRITQELADTSESLLSLYRRLELPMVGCLADMELQGVPIDIELVKKLTSEYKLRVNTFKRFLQEAAKGVGFLEQKKRKRCTEHAYRKELYSVCPLCDTKGMIETSIPFNPASGQQLAQVLQGAMGLPRFASTDAGDPSNDESALLKLREHTQDEDAKEFITVLLAYRKDNKVLGFLKSFQEKARADYRGVYRIHGKFNQAVVESGRLSSKEPNLQQVPSGIVRGVFYAA